MDAAEPIEAQALPEKDNDPLPVPTSRVERNLYVLILVVSPVICFLVSDFLKPEWQSGQFSDYMALLLNPQAAWFFFPFLIYPVVCFALLAQTPERWGAQFIVRFGIYTGTLLALQYAILEAGTGLGLVGAGVAGVLIACRVILAKVKSRRGWIAICVLLIAGAGTLVAIFRMNSPAMVPLLVLVILLLCAPFVCLAVMGVTAIKLIWNYETPASTWLWRGAGAIAWLGAYALAWRFSILQALQIYHSLPLQPPDCYIATASARGHAGLVRSWAVTLPAGELRVTRQLQTLKLAELALLALVPGFHAALRRLYDRCGPLLARRLHNPYLADLAYLALKPFEWVAAFVLRPILPRFEQHVSLLYRPQ